MMKRTIAKKKLNIYIYVYRQICHFCHFCHFFKENYQIYDVLSYFHITVFKFSKKILLHRFKKKKLRYNYTFRFQKQYKVNQFKYNILYTKPRNFPTPVFTSRFQTGHYNTRQVYITKPIHPNFYISVFHIPSPAAIESTLIWTVKYGQLNMDGQLRRTGFPGASLMSGCSLRQQLKTLLQINYNGKELQNF